MNMTIPYSSPLYITIDASSIFRQGQGRVAMDSLLALGPFIILLNMVVLLSCALRCFDKPMVLYIGLTALADMLWTLLNMATFVHIPLVEKWRVTFYKCIAQLFFFAFTNELQTLLIWMINVDRYCAIFWPYAYTAWVAKGNRGWQPAGLIVISSFLSQLPPSILITHASFCSQEVVINNALCLIGFVAEVACKGGALPSIYTFCVFSLVHILTAVTVVHSSWRIVRVCRRTSSVDFRNKALHVCCTQVMVFGVKFCPVFGLAITSRVGLKNVYFSFIMYVALLIASPIANPIIYGLRTKEVREPVVRMWRKTVAQTRPFTFRKSEIQITKQ